jgi:hypothetical protein
VSRRHLAQHLSGIAIGHDAPPSLVQASSLSIRCHRVDPGLEQREEARRRPKSHRHQV